MGWQGKENDALLRIDAFITVDKNLQNQQNFNTSPSPVLELSVHHLTYQDISK
jgi:hypothetical protein